LKIFEIHCKNKYSKIISIFKEFGYDFNDAVQKLNYKLDTLEWSIGYGSL